MTSASRTSYKIESLKAELNAAADEMSDVAEALGLRRDAPHHRILVRVAELRAIERSTPPRDKRTKCAGAGLLIHPQPEEIMSMRAVCPLCKTPDLKIKSEIRDNEAIAKLPSHSRPACEPITADKAACISAGLMSKLETLSKGV